ncbi:hypothetical protein [Actinomadura macra]|uniref:hypothetical protein n=1 Tax=Actinomadura macra TaxID=46164 RepID=UPI00082B3836|nr:hypothetical protein [Actinomadura macra]
MGNCIEWFDFGVFSAGVMTSIIGTVFYPPGESGSASLRSFRADRRGLRKPLLLTAAVLVGSPIKTTDSNYIPA